MFAYSTALSVIALTRVAFFDDSIAPKPRRDDINVCR
jgi:hypothetical protein